MWLFRQILGMDKRVMVIDDDESIREVVTLILENSGFEVVSYSDCNDIVEKVKKDKPCIVLMDLWVPDMGGEFATKTLKANAELSGIPVILFSANNDISKAAQKAGADGHIQKPFDMQEFQDTITRFIHRSEC